MNPERLWRRFRSKSSGSPLGPRDRRSSTSTNDHALDHVVRASNAIALAYTKGPICSPLLETSLLPSLVTASAPTLASNDHLGISRSKPSSPAEYNPGLGATASNAAKIFLEVVKESSDIFFPLKSVAGGLSALLRNYEQCVSNKDDVQRLIRRVKSLASSLIGLPREDDIKEQARRARLKNDLIKVMDSLSQFSKQSGFSSFVNNAEQAGMIATLIEDIRDAIIEYQTSLQQDISDNLYTLIMESQKSQESTDLLILDKLRRSQDAGYLSGDRQKCLRGTRVKVLETIENWVHEDGTRRVYWLNGAAGTGKTTIAHSLAERMFAEGLLGASFFCSRDFADRRNLHLIFPTLAFQLAYKYPAFRAHLVQTIKSNPDVGRRSLENQLRKLLVEPLQSAGVSMVIIIDALDECDDKNTTSAILSLLSREIDQIPLVKFFITGRPEPRIRSGFRLPGLLPWTEVLLLHEVEPRNVYEDIKTFLTYHMKELVKNRSDIDITSPWPSPEDVRIVTVKAGGLFIYASTVIKFLTSANHTPQERLQLITSMPHSSAHEGKSEIDPLYTCMLDNGCADVDDRDSSYFSRLSLVVGSVVLLCDPISVASLAKLLDLAPTNVLTPLRSLHSVLLVPEFDSKPIRVFHKSFPDYITDPNRCQDSRFYVDSQVHHATLAIRCFELMKAGLKKNICDLPQYAMNEAIEHLSARREESIDEALRYACRFWAQHLCSSPWTGNEVTEIFELLKGFIQHQLLQWLEVLSVIKGLRGAVHSLLAVERWLLDGETSDEGLVDSVRECRRFALYCFDPVGKSAAHIYDSALLWLPTSSLVRTLYQDQLRTQVKVFNGIDNFWDACIRSIHLGDAIRVWSVAFSHGGNLIAGCNGSVIKFLEAATGASLATLKGPDGEQPDGDLRSVAFSSQDTFLASGSEDSTVRIWDVQTGALVTRFDGHTNYVRSVAFSPTGNMVASGADDKTIRIWNLSSGGCEHILKGHQSYVLCVCWLQTGKLVSGDLSGVVRVWDVPSRRCLKMFDAHFNRVNSVASSPDGSKFASGSDDKKIIVRDAQTDVVLQTVLAHEKVTSVCFSPDGDKIVYATDISVVVWDLVKGVSTFQWQSGSPSVAFSPDGSCVATGSSDGFLRVYQMELGNQDRDRCNQHLDVVRCVSFVADGRMIASGSTDKTVKLWDAATGLCIHTFHGHFESVRSVAFSPDSSLIASGSIDKSVRVWSVHPNGVGTASCLHTFHGHSDWIRAVAFSPDSSLIASGSDDHTICIWSLPDRNLVKTLEGHDGSIFGIKFSPDGRWIVSVSEYQEIIIWDVGALVELAVLPSPAREKSDSRVSFSADGTRVILEVRDAVRMWDIHPNAEYSSDAVSGSPTSQYRTVLVLPMVFVPVLDDAPAALLDNLRLYRYPKGSEWILDRRDRRVCWVPADRRGVGDSHGKKVVLGTKSGRVVIVDFSDVK